MSNNSIKNECAKRRPVENPYEVWESSDGHWIWKVLKKYQIDDNKLYARWYCCVISPYTPDGDFGDVYVSDVKKYARKI